MVTVTPPYRGGRYVTVTRYRQPNRYRDVTVTVTTVTVYFIGFEMT